ncbi:MAG: transposase, partial [Bacteroidota bacterium]
FADNYLRPWFPDMVESYEGLLTRLNNLHGVFPPLCHSLIEAKMDVIHLEHFKLYKDVMASVVDSMPIILAKGPRSFRAKVAPQQCDKGYCATKKLHYYGVKLHVMGYSIFHKLPLPEYVGISPASNNDLTVFKPLWESIHHRAIFADKIYANKAFEQWLQENNNVQILTPVKKKKGQKTLEFMDKMYSRAVSQIRQPIEAFFNWIIEKVGIQNASKVRSEKGLFVHVFGRFAAALMIMTFDIF